MSLLVPFCSYKSTVFVCCVFLYWFMIGTNVASCPHMSCTRLVVVPFRKLDWSKLSMDSWAFLHPGVCTDIGPLAFFPRPLVFYCLQYKLWVDRLLSSMHETCLLPLLCREYRQMFPWDNTSGIAVRIFSAEPSCISGVNLTSNQRKAYSSCKPDPLLQRRKGLVNYVHKPCPVTPQSAVQSCCCIVSHDTLVMTFLKMVIENLFSAAVESIKTLWLHFIESKPRFFYNYIMCGYII